VAGSASASPDGRHHRGHRDRRRNCPFLCDSGGPEPPHASHLSWPNRAAGHRPLARSLDQPMPPVGSPGTTSREDPARRPRPALRARERPGVRPAFRFACRGTRTGVWL